MTRPRALISTIEPIDGGVPTMTRCLAGMLEDLGIEPVFAWYEPWSRRPDLSVPLPSLLLTGSMKPMVWVRGCLNWNSPTTCPAAVGAI
jgi:hypothetical protein